MSQEKAFCMMVDQSFKDFWVLATPEKDAYKTMTRPESIRKYRELAQEFNKLFKCDNEMWTKDERAIYFPDGKPNVLKRTFVQLAIVYEWNQLPTELQLTSFTYTSPDGYPCGEAVYARIFNKSSQVKTPEMQQDLLRFYWEHNWRTQIDSLKNVEVLETKKEDIRKLDDIVLPTLMQVFKYGCK